MFEPTPQDAKKEELDDDKDDHDDPVVLHDVLGHDPLNLFRKRAI